MPNREEWARYKSKRAAAGLCRSCGKPPETGNYCKRCRTRNANWKRESKYHSKRYQIRRSKGLCASCSQLAEDGMARCRACRYRLKFEVIEAYGNNCQCCNEDEPSFLTIDHIYEDGGGRKRKYSGNAFYGYLKRNGFPQDRYQLLCFNCNVAKHSLGTCPHQSIAKE